MGGAPCLTLNLVCVHAVGVLQEAIVSAIAHIQGTHADRDSVIVSRHQCFLQREG